MTLNMLSLRRISITLAVALVAHRAVAQIAKSSGPAAAPPLASTLTGLPDLVVVGSEDHAYGPATNVSITVRNVGGKDTAKSTTLRTRCVTEVGTQPRCGSGTNGWNVGFVTTEHSYDVSVPPLHKGESFVAQAHYYFGGGAGDYRVRFTAVIDPDNVIAESNEINNTSTFTRSSLPAVGLHPSKDLNKVLAVSTPTPNPGTSHPAVVDQAPQLVPPPTVALLTLSVNPAYAPDKQIWLVAKNNSGSPLGPGIAKLRCDGALCAGIEPKEMPIPALASGEWKTLGSFEVVLHVTTEVSGHTVTISTEGVGSKPLVLKD